MTLNLQIYKVLKFINFAPNIIRPKSFKIEFDICYFVYMIIQVAYSIA